MIYKRLGCHIKDNTLKGYNGKSYYLENDVWMVKQKLSASQMQTSETFAFKWQKEDTFTSSAALERTRKWLQARYGDVCSLVHSYPHSPVVLDAGCGAALSALELFGPCFDSMSYIGVDVSDAVKVACKRIHKHDYKGIFFRESLMSLPFAPNSIDIIFSEGVLHHTDSTHAALEALIPLLRPGGRILFYVYNKKGPIREYTDDYIREKLQHMSQSEAWEALKPLTRLGMELGKKNIEIDVPASIDFLQIPAGKISLQRFFYWHIFKAFYDPQATLEELNHINFDWFMPKNAHRQTPEEVRGWCEASGLAIEHMLVEQSGITVIAHK